MVSVAQKGTYDIIYEKNDILILGSERDEGMTFRFIDKKFKNYHTSSLTRSIVSIQKNRKVSHPVPGKCLIVE